MRLLYPCLVVRPSGITSGLSKECPRHNELIRHTLVFNFLWLIKNTCSLLLNENNICPFDLLVKIVITYECVNLQDILRAALYMG